MKVTEGLCSFCDHKVAVLETPSLYLKYVQKTFFADPMVLAQVSCNWIMYLIITAAALPYFHLYDVCLLYVMFTMLKHTEVCSELPPIMISFLYLLYEVLVFTNFGVAKC